MHRLMTLALLAAALGVLLAAGSAPAAKQRRAATVSVQLLAINDFHGNLEPPSGSGGRINGVDTGGAEYLSTWLKQLSSQNPNTIVVSGGDNIGASPLTSALFHDEPTIEAFNLMNVQVSTVGNHEFDEGLPELYRMQRGGCAPQDNTRCRGGSFTGAKFQYLAANVVRNPTAAEVKAVQRFNAKQRAKLRRCHAHHRKTCRYKLKAKPGAKTIFPPFAVKKIGGVKVGFIGETLVGTPTIVVPTAVAGLKFLPEAATANKYAAILKKQGVRTIVLLIHQGLEQSATDPNGCSTNPSGDALPIVQSLSPDIDVVISAHTHQWYVCTINGRPVTEAASFGRLITKVDLTIDTKTDEVVTKLAKNVLVTRDVPKDAAMTALVQKYKSLSASLANRIVGSITTDITRAETSAGESALGDLIADAQLEATKPANKGNAVVAFMNPGGIRADLVANQQSGGENPGQVTYGEAFTVQPFANVMTVKTMTGDQIKRLLEQQFDNPSAGQRRILQVSAGFTYSYDQSKPAGQRVDASSIKINGQTVVPTQSYRVAMNNFLAAGGDGFTVFKEGTNSLGGDIDVDAFVAYLTAHSPVAPPVRNRITRTG